MCLTRALVIKATTVNAYVQHWQPTLRNVTTEVLRLNGEVNFYALCSATRGVLSIALVLGKKLLQFTYKYTFIAIFLVRVHMKPAIIY